MKIYFCIVFPSLTPTSAVAESDGFLCDNERQRITQKNGAFGNPLDVLVSCICHFANILYQDELYPFGFSLPDLTLLAETYHSPLP